MSSFTFSPRNSINYIHKDYYRPVYLIIVYSVYWFNCKRLNNRPSNLNRLNTSKMKSPNKARSDFLNDLMPFVIAVTRTDRLLWSKHGWQFLGELRIRLWIPVRNRPGLLRESVQSQREAGQAASHSGEETEPPRGPRVWHPSVRHTRSGSSAKNRALQPPQHSQVSMETVGQIAYQRRFEKYSEFSVWALWPLSL